MQTAYHKKIVDYYKATENAYKDSWDLENSLSIHYGYYDDKVKSFPQSLLRMNEIMMEAVGITNRDKVLDAGCGIGGSSIFLAGKLGCHVTGITLSERQAQLATKNAQERKLNGLTGFEVMDYCNTSFGSESFDVIWGCESICYADDKEKFIREAFRLLKQGGRLVVADGFVTKFENNEHPVIRQWLDGWQVNYLETPERFNQFMQQAGFGEISCRDISSNTRQSSRRLLRFYYLASLYVAWKKLSFSNRTTEMQKNNIRACKYQYYGMQKSLWQYWLFTARKP
ncbi:MAG: methyltransferase domain-containing protein [Bacteroidetes bacterium]|nr:MAG: methyltransferase domain-containing protein [Bacteroidota bacterium]